MKKRYVPTYFLNLSHCSFRKFFEVQPRLLLKVILFFSITLLIINGAKAQTNLALGKTVTSSSNFDVVTYPNSNLVDGNFNTFAHTGNSAVPPNAEWLQVDLGADYYIDQVLIACRSNTPDRIRRFMIVTWPSSVTGTNGLGANPSIYLSDANGSLYNRLIYTNAAAADGNVPFGSSTVPEAAGTNMGPAFPANNQLSLNIGVHKARYVRIINLQDDYFDPTELQVFQSNVTTSRTFTNGSFEMATGGFGYVREKIVAGWNTTEAVGMYNGDQTVPFDGSYLEQWTNGFLGVAAPNGNYFMELNAFTSGMLTQNPICVLPGETFNWSFRHRGRNGVDVMALNIDGADVATFADNNGAGGTHSGTLTPAGLLNTTITGTTTDASNGWTQYTGTWKNTTSTGKIVDFGFRAVSSSSGNISGGNFLDDVQLTSLSTLISISPPTASGPETTPTANLPKLRLIGNLTAAATIEVNINGGTATRGTDYTTTPATGVITVPIPAGNYDGTDATAISLASYIKINPDLVSPEADETITAVLQNPSSSNLRIADGNSCNSNPVNFTYTITNVAPFIVNTTQNNVNCFGNATGSATATATGGTAPYSYSWNTSPVQATATANNLSAGTYIVSVTDAGGNIGSATVIITQPTAALNTSNTKTDINCFGASTGAIDLSVSGGTAPYTYAWTGPAGFTATTEDLSARPAGTYNVTVTDAKNCTATASITLSQPAAVLSTTNTKTDINCFGASTGAIDLSVSGGTAPYTYAWTGPAGFTATTEDLSARPAGTYNVTVTDAKNCTATASITLNQPAAALSTTNTKTDINCFGASTGAIDLSVSGGTAPYTYAWTGPAGFTATTEDLSTRPAGTYNVTVTDAKNCTATASITLAQPAAILSTTNTKTDINCFGASTGAINLSVSGGTAPYTYAWTGPAGFTATTEDLSARPAGTYNVTVTDAKNCTATASITLSQPAAVLSTTNTKTDINCFGASTGAIDLSVSGGTAPYTYAWTGPASFTATTEDLSTRPAGTYNVTVTDAKNCTATASITLAQPAAVLSTTNTKTDINCFGASTGAINLSVSGGTAPYTYAWTGPAGFTATTEDLSARPAGTYNVTVTDAKNCTATASITLAQPAAILSTTNTKTDINCFGASTGAIDLSVSGGTAPYTYAWTGPASFTATTEDLSTRPAGTYNVTVTDAKNCTATASITLAQPAAVLSTTNTKTDINCFGASTGAINLSVSGGTAPYTYAWTGPAGFTATTEDLSARPAGTYNVTVTDAKNCTATASINLSQPAILTAPIVGAVTQPSCNTATGSVELSGLPTGNWTITSSSGTTTTGTGATTTISGLVAGSYTFTVTNAAGCTSTASTSVTINTQPPTPTAPVAGTVTQPSCNTATGSVELSGLPTGNWTITSSTGTTTTGTGATTTISGLVAGSYTFTVTNDAGCTSMASASVTINTQPATPAAPAVGTVIQPNCNTATGSVTLSGLPTLGTWTITTAPGGAAITGTGATTTISGLVAGNYTFTVTNASGCTSTASTSVTINAQPPIPTAPIAGTVTQPGCNTATGSVELSGLPTGNWTITSSTGTTTTGTGTTTTISGLTPGSYTFTVTNDVGCTSTASASVNINTQSSVPVAPTVTATQPNCNTATGKITISAPTNPSFTYSIDGNNYQTATTFNAVAPGTYNVTVKNNNGCVSPATSITINAQPPIPGAPVAGTITRANCTVITGSVIINNLPSSGTWTLTRNPDNVSITGTGTSTTISGLSPGTYTFTVTNDVGCISQPSANVLIENPITAPELTFSKIDVDCFGATTGSINLNVSGGTAPYSYQWTGPNGFTSTDKDLMNLGGGVYNVTVTGDGNCTTSASITVTPVGPVVATPTVTNVTCFGGNNGAISLAVSGGTAPYTYAWSNGSTDKDPTGLVAGSYSVTITDSKNCTLNLQNITVGEPSAVPAPTAVVASQPSCSVTTGSVNISGLPNGTWTLTSSTGVVTTGTGASTTISNLTSGNYTFTVTNDAGCISPASAPVTINNQLSTPSAPVPAIPTQPTCSTATGTLELNGLPNGTWTITGTNGVVKTGNGTSTIIDELVPGTYTFTVVNSDGCSSTASAPVTINNQPATPTAPIAAAPTQPTCTVATGSVELSGLPSGAWTVTTSNGGGSISGTGATVVINGLTPGTHIFTVTSSDGCTSAGSDPITINNQLSTPAVPTVDITQPTCTLSTGTITITAPKGATLEYSLDGGTYQSETVFKNVTAGTHNITSKDTNGGCTSAPATITINQADCPGLVIAKAGVLSTDGNTINYTFTVTNTGNVTLKDVKVSDAKLGITDQAITIPAAGLAPGASATGTASYALTQADRDAGKVTNTAAATGTDPSGNPTTDSQSDDPNTPGVQNDPTVVAVTQTTAISIEKAGVLSTDGNTINYTFTVTNTGNVTLKDVKVSDAKLGITDQVITIPAAGLAPGASATGTASYALTQADRDAGKVTNTAAATSTDPSGNPTTDSQSDDPNTPGVSNDPTVVSVTQTPAISIAKAGVLSTDGNTINYTFTVTNTGNVTLRDVKVSDAKLGITDQVITIPAAGLAPGASATGTASYTLTQADRDAGKVTNTATATGTDPSGNPTTDSQSDDPNTPGVSNDPTVVAVKQNNPPVATAQPIVTPQDTPINGKITANDPDGDPLTYTVSTVPEHGTVNINSDGTYTYTPTPGYNGPDSFVTTVCDDKGACTTVTVPVTVTPKPNNPPVATAPPVVTPQDTPINGKITANDPDGDPLTYTVSTVPEHGTVTINPDGTYTYTPTPGYNGPDSFVTTVCDDKGACTTVTVPVTVTPKPNNPPVATAPPIVTAQDTPISDKITANDPDGDPLTYTVSTVPEHGTVNINSDGTYTYTPTPGYNGPDSFVTTVCDDKGACTTVTVPVTVTPKPNNPPVATAPPVVTPQDTPINGKITANDPDGDPLTYTVSTVPEHGTVTINPDGTYTYTPTPGYNGPDSFVTTVCDDKGACTTVTVPVTVTPKPNNPPVATAPPIVTAQDTPISDKITANDPDGDPLTYTVSTVPEHGTVTITPDGTYTYTPTPGYSGPDSFVTTVCDDKGACTTVTVPITVTPKPNNPPVATAPPIVTPQDTPVNDKITANDPDGDPLTYTVSTVPEHGTVSINPDGTYTYTPTPGYNGPDSFVTTVCDDKGACTTVTVPVTVTPKPNNPPVATAPPVVTPQDTPINGKITANDPDGDPLTYTVSTVPEHGTVSINPDGTYTYTPTTGYSGPDSFVTTVCDDKGACTTVTVPVTVTPKPNNPPVATAPPIVTPQDTPVNDKITANDPDGDPLTYTVSTVPEHGTVTINPDGTYTYTPTPGYSGPDSFVTTVCDDKGACTTVTVPVTVTPKPNNPPVATAPPIVTPQDTPINSKITANDPDGDPLTYTVSTVPEHGTVTINPDGTYTYTPTPGYNGPDSFVTTVCDDKGACTTVTVPVTVTPKPNNPPVATAPPIVTAQDTPVNDKITANDPDGDPLTYTVSTEPEHGTVTINPDGTYTYTPTPGYSGPDSFVTTVCDDKGACTTVTVPITVTPVLIANVSVVKTVDNATPVVGSNVVFTINVTNAGPNTATGVTATDLLPSGYTFVSANAPAGTVYNSSTGIWTIGNLANGASMGLSITARVNATGNYANTAIVNAATTDPDATNNRATATTVPVINKPIANNDVASSDANKPVVIQIIKDDNPGNSTFDLNSIEVVDQPKYGTVKINADGTVTYTPNPGYTGIDNFSYRLKDMFGNYTNVASVTIQLNAIALKIPNLFTPNGDGNNDTFEIIGLNQFAQNNLIIVNRWGNEVFHADNYQNNWTGEGLNEGTYYYLLKVKNNGDNGWTVYKGWLTLIRVFKK